MIKKYLIILGISMLFIGFLSIDTEAQILDVSEEPVEEESAAPAQEGPEEVMKLEELIIEVQALKVFSIPRMDAELPPIDFTGLFNNEYLAPSLRFFDIEKENIMPSRVISQKKIFDKERK